jgi:hypothetical protein
MACEAASCLYRVFAEFDGGSGPPAAPIMDGAAGLHFSRLRNSWL